MYAKVASTLLMGLAFLPLSANAQSVVPLPNGKTLELKPSASPGKVTFPEIKPPEKGTGIIGGGTGSSTAIKEQVLELRKKAKFGGGLMFLPDGESILSAIDELAVWDLKTGRPRYVIEGKLYRLGTLQGLFGVSADMKSIYVLEEEKGENGRTAILRHRDIGTGKPLGATPLQREKEILAGFFLTGGGKNAVTVAVEVSAEAPIFVRLIDLSTGKIVKDLTSRKRKDLVSEDIGYASSTLPFIITRITDREETRHRALRLYDAFTGEFRKEISLEQGDEKGVFANLGLGVSADGKTLAISPVFKDDLTFFGKNLRIFDMDTGRLKASIPVTQEKVIFTSLELTPKGDKVALAGIVNPKDGPNAERLSKTCIVLVFDVATGKQIKSWRFEDGPILTITLSPDGSVLACGGMRIGNSPADDIGIVRVLRVNDSPAGGGGKDPVAVKPGNPTPEALAELERLKARFPQFPGGGGDGASAIANYQQQIRDNPNNSDLHLGLGQALAGQNQFTEAATALQKAIDLNPKHPAPRQALAEVLTNHARDAVEKKNWEEAIQRARQAVALQPANAQPHHLLAQSLLQQKDFEAAGRHLKEAQARGLQDTALASKLAEQLVTVGQAQAKMDPKKAVEHFRLAVDIESQQASHHALLGKALRNSGRAKEAVEPLTTAMRLDPMDASHKHAFAALALELGRYRDAEPVLHSILLNRPEDKQAQTALIETFLRQGRQAEAKQLAQHALKGGLAPDDLPEVVRNFLDADKLGKTYQLPGLPSVVGLSAVDAKKALEAAGVKVSFQVGAAAPSTAQVNAVYAMDPEPGGQLDKDTVVSITLYGPVSAVNANLATVPDLSGLSAKAAKDLLEKEGLSGKFQLGNAAPTQAKALTVAKSEPISGMQIAKGSEVTVILFGPPQDARDGLIAVPDLAGLTAARAKSMLEELGFKPAFQLGKSAPTKERSLTVFQSDPAAGARLAKGTEIKVTLHAAYDGKNPDPPEPKDAVTVPDCLTLSVDEAMAKLKAAGFTVTSKVGRAANFAGQVERVYQMEPAPGVRVPRGSAVQLLIYGNRKD